MPWYLKITALAVTVLGFTLAIDLSLATQNLKFKRPSAPFKFSNLLGYFPTVMHRLMPIINLSLSQKTASLLLDLT